MLSVAFSFEARKPSGFVLFQAVPEVACFSVDVFVNLFKVMHVSPRPFDLVDNVSAFALKETHNVFFQGI